MKTVKQFCDEHKACADRAQWALDNCADIQGVWNKAIPSDLVWIATRPRVLTDSEARLFAVHAMRMLVTAVAPNYPQLCGVINTAELYANGLVTFEQLSILRSSVDTIWKDIFSKYNKGNGVALAAYMTSELMTSLDMYAPTYVVGKHVIGTIVAHCADSQFYNDVDQNIATQGRYDILAAWLRANVTPQF